MSAKTATTTAGRKAPTATATAAKAQPTPATGASPPGAVPSGGASSIAAARALTAAATSFAAATPPTAQNAAAAANRSSTPSSLRPASRTAGNPTSHQQQQSQQPPPSSSSSLLPYALLSKEEQKLFQAKFRAAQKTPHLVEIQIRALDGLIAFLKQKRANAGAIIAASLAELKQLQKDEANVHFHLDPLAARIAANKRRRDDILAMKQEADGRMREIMHDTSQAVAKTKHAVDAFQRTQLDQQLHFERTKNMRAPTPIMQQQQQSPSAAASRAASRLS